MSNRKLPEQAYDALQALKDRAAATRNNNFRADNSELVDAIRRMRANEPWTKTIERTIKSLPGSIDIASLTDSWLETELAD